MTRRSTSLCALLVFFLALALGGTAAADAGASCSAYPIVIPESMVQGVPPGTDLTLSEHNWGPGASGWLTWDGDQGAPALAASLLPPGNASTYINPGDPADHQLDLGDWVPSSAGHKWTRAVRDNLGLLLGQDLVVPTFVDERLQGGQLAYRVARFITIRIGLSRAGEFGVRTYYQLSRALQGTGLQAHHLIEQRFAGLLGVRASQMLSIAVTPEEHQVFTNAWRALIPYGTLPSPTSVLDAAREVYAQHPTILKALGL